MPGSVSFLPCNSGSTAFHAPPEYSVFPPSMLPFSISTTEAPSLAAAIAAEMPAPPPPTTTTSAVFSISSPGALSCFRALSAVTSAFAEASAFSVAISRPLLLSVAPVITSMARDWLATISAGISAMATSLTPSVSMWSTTSTFSMALSLSVTATVISPFLPSALPS